jgi:hypothetical protein
LCVFYQIMSDYGSCRIGSANDGEERILTLPIRHKSRASERRQEGQEFVAGFEPGHFGFRGSQLIERFFFHREICL